MPEVDKYALREDQDWAQFEVECFREEFTLDGGSWDNEYENLFVPLR